MGWSSSKRSRRSVSVNSEWDNDTQVEQSYPGPSHNSAWSRFKSRFRHRATHNHSSHLPYENDAYQDSCLSKSDVEEEEDIYDGLGGIKVDDFKTVMTVGAIALPIAEVEAVQARGSRSKRSFSLFAPSTYNRSSRRGDDIDHIIQRRLKNSKRATSPHHASDTPYPSRSSLRSPPPSRDTRSRSLQIPGRVAPRLNFSRRSSLDQFELYPQSGGRQRGQDGYDAEDSASAPRAHAQTRRERNGTRARTQSRDYGVDDVRSSAVTGNRRARISRKDDDDSDDDDDDEDDDEDEVLTGSDRSRRSWSGAKSRSSRSTRPRRGVQFDSDERGSSRKSEKRGRSNRPRRGKSRR